jgi:ubiquitin C-terminal hydrolase
MQGLQNLGNTCAVNTLIQIICRNNFLRDSILLTKIPNDTLATELKEILNIMHNDKNSLSPNKFIKHLFTKLKVFTFGEQLDITELWLLLFEKISEEISTNVTKIEYKKYFDNLKINDNKINTKADYIINKFNNNKTSTWLQNVQGVILNIIECTECNNSSYSFEPFTAIQLDLPKESDESISLTSLFRDYLKHTINNDEWKCEKCNKCTKYKKTQKLWKVPNVLIFFLKRYININKKNQTKININKNINIKNGCILSNNNLEVSYNINSIGCHIGSINSGHYYAICKTNNKFILYDDISIKVLSNQDFLNSNNNCYMIVYSL